MGDMEVPPQRGKVRALLGMQPSGATTRAYMSQLTAAVARINQRRENLGEPQRKAAIDRLQTVFAVEGARRGIDPSLLAKVIIIGSRHLNSTNFLEGQADDVCRVLSEGPSQGIGEYDLFLSEGVATLPPDSDTKAIDANDFINAFWIAVQGRYNQMPMGAIGSERVLELASSVDRRAGSLEIRNLFIFALELRRLGEETLMPLLRRGIYFPAAVALIDNTRRTGVQLEQAVRAFDFLSKQGPVDVTALCRDLLSLQNQRAQVAGIERQIAGLRAQAEQIKGACAVLEHKNRFSRNHG
ncbi:MAG: hypothetical protein NT099_02305 [Candidatus Saganbacteria bacterium]|nr:hypothetical protein [Candidatus Saganbacteria bacterium]